MMRHWFRNTLTLAMAIVFCVGGGEGCQTGEHSSHRQAFSNEGLLRGNAETLRSTVVVPHMEVPMRPDLNVMWCGTFQFAWNEACALAGGELRFRGQQPPATAVLNRKLFGAADLDSDSYVALAGFVRDGIADRINSALSQKFHGQASPVLAPTGAAMRPQDIVVYSYLFKNLEFPVPYERGEYPLPFADVSVDCFGMGPEYKQGRGSMAAQTLIHDYVNENDFVIELQTKSHDDHVVLAKVAPQETLAQTVASVQQRANLPSSPALAYDVLVVPKFNLDITRSYKEVLGLQLVPTAPGMADDLTLLMASQNTRFQMDETGVRLKSEATMSFGCSAQHSPPPKHLMVFDKPFLIMLSRTGAKQPYFALWVANPELLVHHER